MPVSFHPSIHCQSLIRGQVVKAAAHSGGSQGVPGPVRRYNLSALDLGLPRVLCPAGRACNTSPRRWPEDILTRYQNHLSWLLLTQWSKSLTDDCISHPTPKGDASHPPDETYFSRLYPRSRSLCHDLSFVTVYATSCTIYRNVHLCMCVSLSGLFYFREENTLVDF